MGNNRDDQEGEAIGIQKGLQKAPQFVSKSQQHDATPLTSGIPLKAPLVEGGCHEVTGGSFRKTTLHKKP